MSSSSRQDHATTTAAAAATTANAADFPATGIDICQPMGRLLLINGKHVTLYQLSNGSFGAYLRDYLSALTGIEEQIYLSKIYDLIDGQIGDYLNFMFYHQNNTNKDNIQILIAEDGFYRVMQDVHRLLGCSPPPKSIDVLSTSFNDLYRQNKQQPRLQHETIETYIGHLDLLQSDISQKCHENGWPQDAVITLTSRLQYLRVIGQVHNLTTLDDRKYAAVETFLKETHPRYASAA